YVAERIPAERPFQVGQEVAEVNVPAVRADRQAVEAGEAAVGTGGTDYPRGAVLEDLPQGEPPGRRVAVVRHQGVVGQAADVDTAAIGADGHRGGAIQAVVPAIFDVAQQAVEGAMLVCDALEHDHAAVERGDVD